MALATIWWVSLVVVLVSCLKTCDCTTMDMSPYKQNILKEHNEFRKMERASDMNLMKWNDSLARQAANWVERCDFKHEMSGGVGENLAFDSNPGDVWDIMKSSVNSWHDEKREWRYGSSACGHACHYTQMVWASTKQIGCAAKRCSNLNAFGRNIKNALYLVCYYYPRGNWIGKYAYTPGAPCSKCDKGCTCTDTLCDDDGQDISNVIQALPAPAVMPYSGRTVFHSSQSKSPPKTVQRGRSHSWQWSSKGNTKVQFHTKHRSEWQSRTYHSKPVVLPQPNYKHVSRVSQSRTYHSKPVLVQSQPKDKHVSRVIKSKTTSSRCIDRLPSCRMWHKQCKTNRVVQMTCLKTCNRCGELDKIIGYDRRRLSRINHQTDNKTKDMRRRQMPNRTKYHTVSKVIRHSSQKRPSSRTRAGTRAGTRTGPSRVKHQRVRRVRTRTRSRQRRQHRTPSHVLKAKPNPHLRHSWKEVRMYRGQRMRYGGRIGASARGRMLTAGKTQHSRPSPRRQKSKETKYPCSDDNKYIGRCKYWHLTGYCAENQMMREVFCRKTCGVCK